jgi:hypothetical protein
LLLLYVNAPGSHFSYPFVLLGLLLSRFLIFLLLLLSLLSRSLLAFAFLLLGLLLSRCLLTFLFLLMGMLLPRLLILPLLLRGLLLSRLLIFSLLLLGLLLSRYLLLLDFVRVLPFIFASWTEFTEFLMGTALIELLVGIMAKLALPGIYMISMVVVSTAHAFGGCLLLHRDKTVRRQDQESSVYEKVTHGLLRPVHCSGFCDRYCRHANRFIIKVLQ